MRQGQTTQSRIKHQRSVGRYRSPYQQHPYQRGGTIFSQPLDPWHIRQPYDIDPWILRRLRQERNPGPVRQHQRGGKVHPVKGTNKKRINSQRRRR